MGAIRRRSFDDPDGLRELPLLTVSLARIGPNTIGRGVVQPGWHWSEHLAPIMRAETCPVHHVQVLLSGQFAVRMEDGEEATFHPGDVMDIPPGHDAWVVGDEPTVLVDFAGNIEALGLPREHERIVTGSSARALIVHRQVPRRQDLASPSRIGGFVCCGLGPARSCRCQPIYH